MNRRKFLSLLSLTSTSYFFAPIGGWHSDVIVQQRIEYIRLRPGALHDARWWPITHRDGTVSYATQATEYITPENYAISSPWTPELYVSRCHQPGIEFRLAPGEAERWRKEAVPVSYTHLDVYKRQRITPESRGY